MKTPKPRIEPDYENNAFTIDGKPATLEEINEAFKKYKDYDWHDFAMPFRKDLLGKAVLEHLLETAEAGGSMIYFGALLNAGGDTVSDFLFLLMECTKREKASPQAAQDVRELRRQEINDAVEILGESHTGKEAMRQMLGFMKGDGGKLDIGNREEMTKLFGLFFNGYPDSVTMTMTKGIQPKKRQ